MIRKRIAAALGLVAGAVAVPLILFSAPAQANPTTPYMCPGMIGDASTSLYLYSWVQGYGQIVCHYGYSVSVSCKWNAYNGDQWWGHTNPSLCPPRAVPTTP